MSEDRTAPLTLATSRQHLRADCQACTGLCCVAPALTRSADFAIDKPAGRPCPHLQPGSACGIHAELRPRGFAGCDVFDCFGAGQRAVAVSPDWRTGPQQAETAFEVFAVLRQLHELLWHLAEAHARLATGALRDEVDDARASVELLAGQASDALLGTAVGAHRSQTGELLARVSTTLRDRVSAGPGDRGDAGTRPDLSGGDLMGVDLRRTPLRGTSLRGAYLIGADLRDVDLHLTDLLGADLRAADVRGAQLADALFLTRPQLQAAKGDARTTLPAGLDRPRHWAAR